ncbi:unnamed protein product [Dracunculus medinensis]|uniref:GCV_T domain-containing protein n=1 Tax=Dracunculus medinensis TaxID=318479 RepID=A0A0N4UGS7_DRAME|nr:unnamed protein product [Dracunculus medinensis]
MLRKGMLIHLLNRSVLSVRGVDAAAFLQATTTNDINLLKANEALYSLLLNSRGRIVHDMIIYKQDANGCFFIECDASHCGKLQNIFNMYKMHKSVIIEKSILKVFYSDSIHTGSVKDPRVASFGNRVLSENVPDGTLSDMMNYQEKRFDYGIVEGVAETSGEIPFTNKGCYIGQELTNRSMTVLEIRKRVFPFTCSDMVSGTVLNERSETVGRIIACNGRKGLALVNLKKGSTNSFQTSKGSIALCVPHWWPYNLSRKCMIK